MTDEAEGLVKPLQFRNLKHYDGPNVGKGWNKTAQSPLGEYAVDFFDGEQHAHGPYLATFPRGCKKDLPTEEAAVEACNSHLQARILSALDLSVIDRLKRERDEARRLLAQYDDPTSILGDPRIGVHIGPEGAAVERADLCEGCPPARYPDHPRRCAQCPRRPTAGEEG